MLNLSQIEDDPIVKSLSQKEEKFEFYASEAAEKLGYKTEEAVQEYINRTFQICSELNISQKRHFKQTFRYNNGKMYTDWKLSALAYYLSQKVN